MEEKALKYKEFSNFGLCVSPDKINIIEVTTFSGTFKNFSEMVKEEIFQNFWSNSLDNTQKRKDDDGIMWFFIDSLTLEQNSKLMEFLSKKCEENQQEVKELKLENQELKLENRELKSKLKMMKKKSLLQEFKPALIYSEDSTFEKNLPKIEKISKVE